MKMKYNKTWHFRREKTKGSFQKDLKKKIIASLQVVYQYCISFSLKYNTLNLYWKPISQFTGDKLVCCDKISQ